MRDDDAALEQMLDSVVHELNHRRTEFSIAGCANLEEYVQTTGEELHRIVVILDETSMILDTTGRDKDGKAVVASITNKLLAIGRLGRALGIHLLVATQRPDVGSVPGSLKAQLDGRICGHTADAQSSIVILDDGSAAKLPAIPGRFIIRNGSGSDRNYSGLLLSPVTKESTMKNPPLQQGHDGPAGTTVASLSG
ncbi:MAG: hypothetical protein ACLUZX_02830 [Subdoligranulum sp.]